MTKRLHDSDMAPAAKRFCRAGFSNPFGFQTTACFDVVRRPGPIGETTRLTNNVVTSFRNDKPVFTRPKQIFSVNKVDGIYVHTREHKSPILKAQCHTEHTLSVYRMAYDIYQMLLRKPRVKLVEREAAHANEISLQGARKLNRPAHSAVWVHAKYLDQNVVLKTTTRLSTMYSYIIEAVIHERIMRRSPMYVPKLIRVAFESRPSKEDRLVICSEELRSHKSVFNWLMELRGSNTNFRLWKMLRMVCKSLDNVQRVSKFTHRDCHCNNVYYDETSRKEKIKFIDFDWSTIDVGKIVSVPQYLYDTTRPKYGQNKSVDVCVFMRTLGNAIRKIIQKEQELREATEFTPATMKAYRYIMENGSPVRKFYDHIWKPLMARYEKESRIVLNKNAGDSVAVALFKLNRGPDKSFGHEHGIRNLDMVAKAKRALGRKADGGKIFDYRMAHYEYPCMTPKLVIAFLDENREKMY